MMQLRLKPIYRNSYTDKDLCIAFDRLMRLDAVKKGTDMELASFKASYYDFTSQFNMHCMHMMERDMCEFLDYDFEGLDDSI